MNSMVSESTSTVKSFDGTQLACHIWEPQTADSNRPIALIHHGAAYHGGAYARLGRVLAGAGIPALALDARGHGLSDGKRGNLERSAVLLNDLEIVAGGWKATHPGRPLILIGESMGGLVTLLYAARARNSPANIDALVLSAPGLTIHLHQVFNRDILTSLPRSLLSRNSTGFSRPADRQSARPRPQAPKASPGDEAEDLALHGFSANYIFIVAGMSIHSPRAAIRVHVPTLIVHGKKDDVVPFQGSLLLHRMIRSHDKQLALYPEDGHTLFWSQEDAPVYRRLLRWIDHRFPA